MAKASKKRAKKKSAKRKSPARKAGRKKTAAKRKKSARKSARRTVAKRKTAKRKPAKRKSVKRKQGNQGPAGNGEGPWPVLFAAAVAFLVGLAAILHFTDFTMVANAAANPAISPISGMAFLVSAVDIGCEPVQAADTWIALMHADLAPGAS